MSTAAELVESAKKLAAFQAVDEHLLPSHRYVGIGSGSTVVYVVEAIVSKGPSFYGPMTFIPTGSQSKGLIRAAGLTLANLDERPVVDGRAVQLDVCFDGADEVDDDLNLIKGGGACLFQEKLVAVAAKKFVAVAGEFTSHKSCMSILDTDKISRLSETVPPAVHQVEDHPHRGPTPRRAGRARPPTGYGIAQSGRPLRPAQQGRRVCHRQRHVDHRRAFLAPASAQGPLHRDRWLRQGRRLGGEQAFQGAAEHSRYCRDWPIPRF